MNNKTQTETYLIRTLSNMHVGSGDNNYGIVDRQVQRDVTDADFPTIHSSGIKGAFRELFESKLGKDHKDVINVFGTSKDKSGSKDDMQAGNYHFFNALFLSLPIRSNVYPYYNGTSPDVLRMFVEKAKLFESQVAEKLEAAFQPLIDLNPENGKPLYFNNADNLILEDFRDTTHQELLNDSNYQFAQKLLGERIALFNHHDLRLLAKELPIIARNSLDNGQSINLFYEEVVPRETRFYFFVKHNDDKGEFENGKEDIIQLGGNASIGNGYSLVKELNKI